MSTYIIFIVLIIVLYFLTIRPQNKKEKEINNLRNNIRPGDQIITIGGVYGKIVRVKEDTLIMMVDNGSKMEIAKWAVSSLADPEETKARSTMKGGEAGKASSGKVSEDVIVETSRPSKKNIKRLGAAEEVVENETEQE